jgi:8-oxo-dGTP pyrophosphatase MutT (NUDIX family)
MTNDSNPAAAADPAPAIDALSGKPIPEARPAATIVIFRDMPSGPPELLMVERSAKMAFAAGAVVFPGGRVDPEDFALAQSLGHDDVDEYAARIAAIREAIEETGIAVGIVGDIPEEQLIAARAMLHDGQPMRALCDRFGWMLDLEAPVPFTRWKPPFAEARVFDTRFYLIAEDDDSIEAMVDQTENRRLFWASAQAVLDKADAGEVKIIFPTRRNLERLAQFGSLAEAIADAKAHPVVMVSPQIAERDGEKWLTIPEGIGYPVTSEKLDSAMRG